MRAKRTVRVCRAGSGAAAARPPSDGRRRLLIGIGFPAIRPCRSPGAANWRAIVSVARWPRSCIAMMQAKHGVLRRVTPVVWRRAGGVIAMGRDSQFQMGCPVLVGTKVGGKISLGQTARAGYTGTVFAQPSACAPGRPARGQLATPTSHRINDKVSEMKRVHGTPRPRAEALWSVQVDLYRPPGIDEKEKK